MEYTFNDHLHNYAVWTAARAVQRNFTRTKILKNAIETTELRSIIHRTDIKTENDFDKFHNQCCREIIGYLEPLGIQVSYGRAAKIVSIYIKTAIVIRDSGKSQIAKVAHPPIDSILLKNLDKEKKIGISKIKWTKMDEVMYVNLISDLRKIEKGEFWKIERYWNPIQNIKRNN
jgi:hypothetical protein